MAMSDESLSIFHSHPTPYRASKPPKPIRFRVYAGTSFFQITGQGGQGRGQLAEVGFPSRGFVFGGPGLGLGVEGASSGPGENVLRTYWIALCHRSPGAQAPPTHGGLG